MIAVMIPALNEEASVAVLVHPAKQLPHVTEVIVVDDKSLDKTVEVARNAGATIITSTKLGKVASRKDGVLAAKNEIVAFLEN
ncbi:MAG: glycosyltransferase [Bacteroidota bacterium]